MQPSTKKSKKYGAVSSSICSIVAVSFSIYSRFRVDRSMIVAPSSAALPIFYTLSSGMFAMNPLSIAFDSST